MFTHRRGKRQLSSSGISSSLFFRQKDRHTFNSNFLPYSSRAAAADDEAGEAKNLISCPRGRSTTREPFFPRMPLSLSLLSLSATIMPLHHTHQQRVVGHENDEP